MSHVAFQKSSGEVISVFSLYNRHHDQTVLRFVGREEHYTIHEQGVVLLGTHFYPHAHLSTNEEAAIEIAQSLNYENPQRHGMYAEHRRLVRIEGENGYFLGGRRIDLNIIPQRARYNQNILLVIPVAQDSFMLNIYFCTDNNSCGDTTNHVITNLGSFCLRVSYAMV